ncbi:MAG: DUF2130 domain-containing protein [Actinobacteria bacterium]|nr:MAG: DUF2130 domain-containing protein [Actinomycetota bacterium]
MQELIIECPYCQKSFALDKVLYGEIEQTVRSSVETEFSKREKKHIQEIEAKAKKETEMKIEAETAEVQAQLKQNGEQLSSLRNDKLIWLKDKKALEDKAKNMELEIAERLDKERVGIEHETEKRLTQAHELEDKKREKMITDLENQVNELNRKLKQGSSQLQGETLELKVEEILKANYPFDEIKEIAKGVNGADVLQKVRDKAGNYCGSILWEAKYTKAWSDSWLDKLKEDQKEAAADICTIVSIALPKHMKHFPDAYKGVWVSDYSSLVGLSGILRFTLVEQSKTRRQTQGKNEKMEVVFNYITGPEFTQRVRDSYETYESMMQALEQERKVMQKIWARREKEIRRVAGNTFHVYGSLQGIVGNSMPEIESLELKALVPGDDM